MSIIPKRAFAFKSIVLNPGIWFLLVPVLAYNDHKRKLKRVEQENSFVIVCGIHSKSKESFHLTQKQGDFLGAPPYLEKNDQLESTNQEQQFEFDSQEAAQRNLDYIFVPNDAANDTADILVSRKPIIKRIEEIIKDNEIEGEEKHLYGKEDFCKVIPGHNADAPGEWGVAVTLDDLTAGEKREMEEGEQKHAFNVYASDMVSLQRALQDVRYPQ